MENGWSMKHIHKLIALSGTYGQKFLGSRSSRFLERGRRPAHPHFSRGPRLRMSAEMIRDNAPRRFWSAERKNGRSPRLIRRSLTGFGVKPDVQRTEIPCGQKRGSFPSRVYVIWRRAALRKFREFRRSRPFVLFPQEEPDQHPFAGVDSSQ